MDREKKFRVLGPGEPRLKEMHARYYQIKQKRKGRKRRFSGSCAPLLQDKLAVLHTRGCSRSFPRARPPRRLGPIWQSRVGSHWLPLKLVRTTAQVRASARGLLGPIWQSRVGSHWLPLKLVRTTAQVRASTRGQNNT